MGFADAYSAYLQKHAIGGQLVSEAPDPQLNTIIAIPAYNESGLTTCLDSLFHCDPPLAPTEVLVLINSAKSSSREIVAANRRSYEEVKEWIRLHRVERRRVERRRVERSEAASQQRQNNPDSDPQDNTTHDPSKPQQQESNPNSDPQDHANRGQDPTKPQEKLRFHVVLVEDLPDKHFGAGLARKLVMDEAVRRLAGKSAEVQDGRAAGNHMEKGAAGDVSLGEGSLDWKAEEEIGGARGAAPGQSAEEQDGRTRRPAPGQSAEEQAGRAAKKNDSGIIVSLDADTVVRRDYLRALEDHFSRHPMASGCSISFEHPLSRQEQAQLFSKASNRPKENPSLERLSPENRTPQNPPPENLPPEVFEAVTNYELHQRYYLQAVRYTGYPYAYHTVGSCFSVQVEAYCRAGGMSRRKAGEDFYFIQKVAMQDGFTECRSTRVYPSPRPSDRVPFGTGPDISRQIGNGQLDASAKHLNDRDSYGTGPDNRQSASGSGAEPSAKHLNDRDSYGTGPDNRQLPPYLTYNPELFEHLRIFFALIPRLYRSGSAAGNIVTENEVRVTGAADAPATTDGDPGTAVDADHITVKDRGQKEATENDPLAKPDGDPPTGTEKAAVLKGVPPVLARYLEESGFWVELEEIRGNTASEGAFRKRFFNKFNMFRILKYLHYAEEHGVAKMEVTAAAGVMLEMWEREHCAGTSGMKETGDRAGTLQEPDFAAGGEAGRVQEPDGKGLELESPDRRKNEEEGSVDGAPDGMGPDGMGPDGMGPESGGDSPIREKDSPIRKKDSPISGGDSPIREKDSPIREKDSPIREKDSPIREKDSPISGGDSPISGGDSPSREKDSPIREKDSPIREKDSPIGSPTREMLLLYRKHFG